MRRRQFLRSVGAVTALAIPAKSSDDLSTPPVVTEIDERSEWIATLTTLADPLLTALAADRLKATMPVEARTEHLVPARRLCTHLEGFGRLMCGMAPWLGLPSDDSSEGKSRARFTALAHDALKNTVDPKAKDFLNFSEGTQPLVDASFLALALIRAPRLWSETDASTKQHLLTAFRSTRSIKPHFNNWLLFSGMIEAFFCSIGEEYDTMRIDYALRQHEQWYKGDGVYGDGPEFHWDYYNSYVIQPFMRTILGVVAPRDKAYAAMLEKFDKISARYAAIQERLINADGSFPAIGRSIAYRCGAFHHLANEAFGKRLPRSIVPAQVRGALGAVIARTLKDRSNYDANGWLVLGLSGHQPKLAEDYISTGSLYLAATAFLPLGLPRDDEFWSSSAADWTAKKIWRGDDLPADQAFK